MTQPALPSARTVDLLRAAIQALAQNDDSDGRGADADPASGRPPAAREREADATLQRALQALCDEAHRHGARAEQLLIALKTVWPTLPEVRALPGGEERAALLARVVTRCLDVYYETSR